jgi:hypothetical protein
MYQNDTLTALCTIELKYRIELADKSLHIPNRADLKCDSPRPNGREILVIRNGGLDDIDRALVIPPGGPGLPPSVLAPMEPGIIQRAGVSAANPAPVPTPAQSAPQPASRPTPATGAAPVSTAPPAQPASDRGAPVQAVPPASSAAGVDPIIDLVKGGMSEALVIKTIQRQSKRYNLGPEDLLKLQKAGVSEKIIEAMLDPADTPATTPVPAQTAAPPTRTAQAPVDRQQQIAERRVPVQKFAACQQQAAKDHPEGGADLAKAYAACTQALLAK